MNYSLHLKYYHCRCHCHHWKAVLVTWYSQSGIFVYLHWLTILQFSVHTHKLLAMVMAWPSIIALLGMIMKSSWVVYKASHSITEVVICGIAIIGFILIWKAVLVTCHPLFELAVRDSSVCLLQLQTWIIHNPEVRFNYLTCSRIKCTTGRNSISLYISHRLLKCKP